MTSRADDRVLRYSGQDGRFLETFLDASDGLSTPDGIAFGRDGLLYIANQATGDILKFNATTGASAGTLATFGGAGNVDLYIDANGSVFASNSTANVIREFSGATGATVRDIVTAAAGQMTVIGGFTFGPDGRLYVVDIGGDRVVQYESNGTYIGDYVPPAAGLSQPIDLAFSASHQVKVSAKPVTETDTYTVAEGGTLTESITSNWISASWKQRQEITFDNGGGPVLTEVPVSVKFHATAVDAINIDYSKTQDGGEDIRFVDTDGTLLSHEIESWDEGGYSYVWVKVPQIDAGSTTDSITMYFDNPHATDGSSRTAVWNPDDVAVLHLNGSTTGLRPAGNDGETLQPVQQTVLSAAGHHSTAPLAV